LEAHTIRGTNHPSDVTLASEVFGNAVIRQQREDVIGA